MLTAATAFAEDFPAWMDEVEFKRNSSSDFQLNAPAAPVDPETGQVSDLGTNRSRSIRPKLPDFSKLREKAIKATSERKASDSLDLQNTLDFSANNLDKLEKSRTDLLDLLKTITDPAEKQRLENDKLILDRRIDAATQLMQLLGADRNNIANQLSQLSESDFKKALELQQLIFSRPSDFKKNKTASESKKKPAQQKFYKPSSKFKSFYLESKQKAAEESDEEP